MAQPTMQMSFSAGEWAPALNARVDLAKYRTGAALLRNFFVDYRGGASTRPGTRYVLQAYKSLTNVRLIPFQASFAVSYMLEFGDMYIRFFNNGAPVLEAAKAITGLSQASVVNVNIVGHGYQTGEWVFISGVTGMTQLNGRYFIVGTTIANDFQLKDLFGNNVNSTGYGAWTGGGIVRRVYTIPSPYTAAELDTIKFAQNNEFMVLCHANHQPFTLTFKSSADWVLAPIVFGTTMSAPTNVTQTSFGPGAFNFGYLVTAVDDDGQESGASAIVTGTVAGAAGVAYSIAINFNPVPGATSYNIYRSGWSANTPMPIGSAYGLVANINGVSFIDNYVGTTSSNPADYSLTPPLLRNPFQGAGVDSVTVTSNGVYNAPMVAPTATFSAPPLGGAQATGQPFWEANQLFLQTSTSGWAVGQLIQGPVGIVAVVASVLGSSVTGIQPLTYPNSNRGFYNGATVNSPLTFINGFGASLTALVQWRLGGVQIISAGAGYLVPPTITLTPAGSPTGTVVAVLGDASAGNPTVPIFFQQRLVLAGPPGNPQQFDMSQPGSYYNFNISKPIQPDDAIQGFLVSGQLNSIKSMVVMSKGLIILSDKQAWVISAPSGGGVTPIDIAATGQAYNGASDLPPVVVTYDVLYGQSKGSIVRDLTYNFYTDIYTGTDVTVLSSHLFYGHTLISWAYAEEPFKVLWAVREDGILLSLSFLKEQELVGWAHSDTIGLFKSVGTIVESGTVSGTVDALYCVVQRTVNGQSLRYIERMAERRFIVGGDPAVNDVWCVDAALGYNGVPATTFTGAEHLVGVTVTGIADGVVIPPFVMPLTGTFTLATPASKVVVGIGFSCQMQTLGLDLGEPTVQGKRKKITGVTLRVQETLGLSIGRSFGSLVPMKDLIQGNLGSMTNAVVTDLITGDVRTNIDPLWDVPGQYCIQQSGPLPATILGVIPEINVGDSPK